MISRIFLKKIKQNCLISDPIFTLSHVTLFFPDNLFGLWKKMYSDLNSSSLFFSFRYNNILWFCKMVYCSCITSRKIISWKLFHSKRNNTYNTTQNRTQYVLEHKGVHSKKILRLPSINLDKEKKQLRFCKEILLYYKNKG